MQPSGETWTKLSPRECEAIALIVDGLTNRQIAARMGVSTSTVKGYVADIFRKANVDNRTSAPVWWSQHHRPE